MARGRTAATDTAAGVRDTSSATASPGATDAAPIRSADPAPCTTARTGDTSTPSASGIPNMPSFNQAHFEGRRVVDWHDQREEAAGREVNVARSLPGRVEHIGERELHRFALGQQPAQIAAAQRLEQALDCMHTLGHEALRLC